MDDSFGIGPEGDNILTTNCSLLPIEKDQEHMRKIVAAVNNTWGTAINPDAVPEVLRTLKNMCDYFEWLIKDPNFPAYREAKAAIEKATIK